MAYQRLKTEMKGDTSRWTRRAVAKHEAKRLRRAADKRASAEEPPAAKPEMTKAPESGA